MGGAAAASRMQWVVLLFLCLKLRVVSAIKYEEIEVSLTSYLVNHVIVGKGQNALMEESVWHVIEQTVSSTSESSGDVPTHPPPADESVSTARQGHMSNVPIHGRQVIRKTILQKELFDWSPWFEYFTVLEISPDKYDVVRKIAYEVSQELIPLVEAGNLRKRIVKALKVYGNGVFHAAAEFALNAKDNPEFHMLCWWPNLNGEEIGLPDNKNGVPPCDDPPKDPAYWVETVIGDNFIVSMELLIPGDGGAGDGGAEEKVEWFVQSRGMKVEGGKKWVKLMDVAPNKVVMIPGSFPDEFMHYLLLLFKVTIDDVEMRVYHPLFCNTQDYAITYHVTNKLIEFSSILWNEPRRAPMRAYTSTTPIKTLHTWFQENNVPHSNAFAKPPAILYGPLPRIHRVPFISPTPPNKIGPLKAKRFRSVTQRLA